MWNGKKKAVAFSFDDGVTKDVAITQKSDLFFYTEDESERAKRSRDCTDICESYQEQTSEHYTYNDYLHH